jgi:hypothetical protein
MRDEISSLKWIMKNMDLQKPEMYARTGARVT